MVCFLITDHEIQVYYLNYNLDSVVTPVRHDIFEHLLIESGYDRAKMYKLVNGFKHGFDICYQGPVNRKSFSQNLPLNIGSTTVLWNKLMKEVKLKHIVGPFDQVHFEYFIQSPIGLVPKDSGTQMRLIFHLSYDFRDGRSVNYHTPKDLCSVQYHDLDEAIQLCLFHLQQGGDGTTLWFGKTDVQSTFRVLGLSPKCWPWLVMKVTDPRTGKVKF